MAANASEYRYGFMPELLASDEATGGRPVLPEGSRAAVEEALRELLVDHDALTDYVHQLQRRFFDAKRQGRLREWHHHVPLPDETAERIVVGGPAALDALALGGESALASLALNYSALLDLHGLIDERLPDAWRSALRANAQRLRLGRHIDPETALGAAGIAAESGWHEEAVPPLHQPARESDESTSRGTLPWAARAPLSLRRLTAGVGWALAASLLVGIGILLGRAMSIRPGGPRSRAFEVLLAEGRPRPGVVRGGPDSAKAIVGRDNTYRIVSEGDFVVEIRSPRKGFATIVLFNEVAPPDVFPAAGQPNLEVEPFVSLASPSLPLAGRTTVVVLVTPTPSGELVQRFLGGKFVPPGQRGPKMEEVKKALQDEGCAWLAIDEVVVVPQKAP
jgi:hypothetical protein